MTGRWKSTLQSITLFCGIIGTFSSSFAVPTLNIPNIPLIMATPIHPQVLFTLGNSQSMDGTLSGAIMSGSGSSATSLSSLSNSSSPLNYTVPTGFIPPVQAADASGLAPYTVLQGSTLYDNGPSRLNMAKAAITAIIENYMASTDFALATYNVSNTQTYKTWVYYMSPNGSNFIPTNTQGAGKRYVNNPCYNYTSASSTVNSNCAAIATVIGSLSASRYLQIGASSDDPNINDILYSRTTSAGIYLTYTGPSPASPFPPYYSLTSYNNGNVLIGYSRSQPNIGSFSTAPTNAGFVAYSPQVMYSQRGFGYYGTQSATSGKVIVPMTTAGSAPSISSVATAIAQFTPFLQPETNALATTEIKAAAAQAPTAGLLKQANAYLQPLAPTSGNGCPQKKYVILISDGLPTEDLSARAWPPLGSASATGYGVTATFNADGTLNSTNAQALTDAINSIKTLKNNGILTYVIGMGAGVDPT